MEMPKIHFKSITSFSSVYKPTIPIPNSVDSWKRSFAESLNICYERDYLDNPLCVLEKIPTLQPLSKGQIDFVELVQSLLQFDASYRRYDETYNFYTAENGLKTKLTAVIQKLNKDTTVDGIVKFKVSRFLKSLDRFLSNMETQRRNYQDYEVNSTHLIGSFAEMCCIEAITCSEANQSTWKNLKGTKEVVSRPDFRFYKSGLEDSSFFGEDEVMVSVCEIKPGSQKLERRLNEMNADSDRLSLSSDSSVVSLDIPQIDLDDRILGQHAGELLLDLDRYRLKKTKFKDEDYIMTMPGMIVVGTQVFFMMLEMARSHHRKIRYNEDLDLGADKATIYYTKPLDILVERDRNVLIENFMRLNNI